MPGVGRLDVELCSDRSATPEPENTDPGVLNRENDRMRRIRDPEDEGPAPGVERSKPLKGVLLKSIPIDILSGWAGELPMNEGGGMKYAEFERPKPRDEEVDKLRGDEARKELRCGDDWPRNAFLEKSGDEPNVVERPSGPGLSNAIIHRILSDSVIALFRPEGAGVDKDSCSISMGEWEGSAVRDSRGELCPPSGVEGRTTSPLPEEGPAPPLPDSCPVHLDISELEAREDLDIRAPAGEKRPSPLGLRSEGARVIPGRRPILCFLSALVVISGKA